MVSLLKPINSLMKSPGPDCLLCTSRKDSIFHFCSMGELEVTNEHKTCQIYKKGQVIFHEGSQPYGFYCIYSGKIKIIKKNSEGKEQIIRLAKPGDPIGYRSVLSDTKYSATAIAMEAAEVCFIPRDYFSNLIAENEKVSLEIIRRLSVALGDAEERMARMALRTVKERLAESLLLLHRIYNTNDGKNFEIVISREDLASIVGTAKETAIRFLSEFKEANILTTQGSKIILLDLDQLTKISELHD